MKRILPLLFVLLLAAFACASEPGTLTLVTVTPPSPENSTPAAAPAPENGSNLPVQVGYGYGASFYEVYFTEPFDRASLQEEGGIDSPLVQAIDGARVSVDIAAYSLSLSSIRNALLNAHARGVQVRVVMESDNMDKAAPMALEGAGIPMVGDNREGLMHNKFVIIDRSDVWLGSTNFTTNGVYEDNNNLLRIRSSQVAQNYLVEFEEMFADDFFGADTVAATPYQTLTLDGIPLEVYFSPDDGVAARISALLRGAEESIYFLAYSFTTDDFSEIIRRKAEEGVTVAGVMEDAQIQSNQGTEYYAFVQAGLPVYADGNAGQMHHKVFIIDRRIVITGSYNFSASAERRNDENIVILHDPTLAARYLEEFERVYAEGKR